MCYCGAVKTYIHSRLGKEDRQILDVLKRSTGSSESELVRRGLRLVAEEEKGRRSALELVGETAGRFKGGPRDLSTGRSHLEGFGA